jgi:hypothetical protein
MPTPDDLPTLYSIGGAVMVMAAGGFAGFRWVMGQVKLMGSLQTIETKKTTIVTADTVAMDRLTSALDHTSVILTETNILRREELADRKLLRESLEENSKMTEHAADQAVELRREMRDLAIQMARSGK